MSTPWDMAAVQHTAITRSWFLHPPFTAHDPLKDISAYIVCASLSADESATRNEALDRNKEQGRATKGYPNEADWFSAFGPSTRQLNPLQAGSGFNLEEQLAVRFLFDNALLGDVVWVMGNHAQLNVTISSAALAQNMKPMLLVDDDIRDKIEIVLQAAASLRDYDEMWREYKDPACVYTIIALAKAAVPDSESDPTNIRKMHFPPIDCSSVNAVDFTNTQFPNFVVKASCHKTMDDKEIGLGVFTTKDFKKGDHAFKVFNYISYFFWDLHMLIIHT
jgi:hypothetical protein